MVCVVCGCEYDAGWGNEGFVVGAGLAEDVAAETAVVTAVYRCEFGMAVVAVWGGGVGDPGF